MGDSCQELQCTSSDGYVFVSPGKMINSYNLSSFKVKNLIGEGGEGSVYKAYNENNQCVAIKVFREQYQENSNREIKFLLNHSHDHIVDIIGLIVAEPGCNQQENPGYLGYVMSYMGHGSLAEVISDVTKQYSIKTACLWIQQTSDALQYLHENGMFHRDVKPHNILLAADNYVKLADFGTARSDDGDDLSSWVGTDPYMAPEIVSKKYGSKADIFSLGITIWQIMHRQRPYDHMAIDKSGRSVFQLRLNVDKMNENVYKIVERCLLTDMENRPSANEILHYFQTDSQNFLPREATTLMQPLYNEVEKNVTKTKETYISREHLTTRPQTFAFTSVPNVFMKLAVGIRTNPVERNTSLAKIILQTEAIQNATPDTYSRLADAYISQVSTSERELSEKADSLLDKTML